MIREGRVTGYMSIRTRATDDEIAAVEPLYQALNEGRCSKRIHKGLWFVRACWANCPLCLFAGECVVLWG